MDKEEIINAYIEHIRRASTLSDAALRDVISRSIEKDSEQLNMFEKLLFKKENINLTTLTYAQSTKLEDNDSDFQETGTEINIYVENGCLSADELKKLTQCVREIEQNNTERVIKIWMNTPEKTVEEMENVINSIKPGFPHKMVIKGPKLSQDDNWTKF